MSTPVRRQYLQIKRQYPDAILFFRLGDFYETFDEDAKLAARELDIVLTSRNIGTNQRIPLAGIPYHAAEGYIAKLINKGYKVAICEQVGEAVKGLMPREVVRVVTPGTVVEESLLEQRRNNYLVALVLDPQGGRAGLAYADITTGDFAATQWAGDDAQAQLAQELQRLQPRECLWPAEGPPSPSQGETLASHREASHGAGEWGAILPDHTHLTPYDPWRFELETARQALLKHFDVATLDGYGCAGWPAAIRAAGALVQYLQETQPAALTQLTRLQSYSTAAFMTLDPATRRNLELNESTRDRALKGSLLWVLDATETAMGGRLLRRWLNQPLLDLDALVARQDAVAALHDHVTVRAQVRAALHKVADLERLTGRVAQGIAGPRALIALRESLEQVPALRDLLEQLSKSPSSQFNAENAESAEITRDISASSANSAVKPAVGGRLSAVISALDPAPDTVSLIAQAIADDAPATPGEGTIRPGFSAELDGVRALARGDRDWV
ncbi:MAG: DNA mismatch repair protein MutS, partial [Chloroflexi bacterium]|nr:DNA mismatch repair protein MutS [Chloroflexota bacterium]